MKPDPVRVIVLARYAAAGLTLGSSNGGFTMQKLFELGAESSILMGVSQDSPDIVSVPFEPYVTDGTLQPT
jgi:hypothetical protein